MGVFVNSPNEERKNAKLGFEFRQAVSRVRAFFFLKVSIFTFIFLDFILFFF